MKQNSSAFFFRMSMNYYNEVKNKLIDNEINENMLKRLILEDVDYFLIEIGEGFSYIKNEYKIKFGDRYNYM